MTKLIPMLSLDILEFPLWLGGDKNSLDVGFF